MFTYALAMHADETEKIKKLLLDRLEEMTRQQPDETETTPLTRSQLMCNRVGDIFEPISGELSLFDDEGRSTAKMTSMFVQADLEQNLFRGIIRDSDLVETYVYTVFCDLERPQNQELFKKTREHFGALGAAVIACDEPFYLPLFRLVSRKGDSNAKKIYQFVSGLPEGAGFTTSDILTACHIDQDAFDKAKENNPRSLGDYLRQMYDSANRYTKLPDPVPKLMEAFPDQPQAHEVSPV